MRSRVLKINWFVTVLKCWNGIKVFQFYSSSNLSTWWRIRVSMTGRNKNPVLKYNVWNATPPPHIKTGCVDTIDMIRNRIKAALWFSAYSRQYDIRSRLQHWTGAFLVFQDSYFLSTKMKTYVENYLCSFYLDTFYLITDEPKCKTNKLFPTSHIYFDKSKKYALLYIHFCRHFFAIKSQKWYRNIR